MFDALLFQGWMLETFSIDFASIPAWISIQFSVIYAYGLRYATKPCEPCFWTTVLCCALKRKSSPFYENMRFIICSLFVLRRLELVLITLGLDYRSIWESFGIMFCIIYDIFRWIWACIVFSFWTNMLPQRRRQEGPKTEPLSSVYRKFLVRFLLGHHGSGRGVLEPHDGTLGFSKGCSGTSF